MFIHLSESGINSQNMMCNGKDTDLCNVHLYEYYFYVT